METARQAWKPFSKVDRNILPGFLLGAANGTLVLVPMKYLIGQILSICGKLKLCHAKQFGYYKATTEIPRSDVADFVTHVDALKHPGLIRTDWIASIQTQIEVLTNSAPPVEPLLSGEDLSTICFHASSSAADLSVSQYFNY